MVHFPFGLEVLFDTQLLISVIVEKCLIIVQAGINYCTTHIPQQMWDMRRLSSSRSDEYDKHHFL